MKEKTSPETKLLREALDVQVKQNSELLGQNKHLLSELQKQGLLVGKLQSQVDQLLRLLFGKKSEKKAKSEEENNEQEVNLPEKIAPTQKAESQKQKPKRKPLPEHLVREKIKYELPESERMCQCQRLCHMIGKEITEQLEFIPARFYVKQHVRYKYACSLGCEVKIAPLPPQPINKAIAGAGLIADVLISKYQDAMPLYRQSLRFKRHDVEIPNSTLCDWVGYSADRLQPIVFALKAELLKHKKLHTDDTIVPVLAPGKTKQGRLWVYVADGSFGYKATVYDYTPTRSQRGPQAFLTGFSGYLQADAYAGYDALYQSGDVIEVGCLAHARRKFFEIAQTVKGESHAKDALIKISEIYAIEAKVRNAPHNIRYYYRKKYLKPLYRQLHRWLVKKQKMMLDKTPIQQAFNYALNHWRALQNVLAHGSLEVGRVENWRADHNDHVSSPRSSNRTCAANASGFRTKYHTFALGTSAITCAIL